MVHANQLGGAWPVRRLGDVRLALPAVGAHYCRKDPCACRLVRYGVLADPWISAKVGRPDMSTAWEPAHQGHAEDHGVQEPMGTLQDEARSRDSVLAWEA